MRFDNIFWLVVLAIIFTLVALAPVIRNHKGGNTELRRTPTVVYKPGLDALNAEMDSILTCWEAESKFYIWEINGIKYMMRPGHILPASDHFVSAISRRMRELGCDPP